jgi:AcrR family transcriptional regulator
VPRARFDRLSPEKRIQILRAAGQEFAEHGYDGATMQRILSDAGISAGAAYYYFDSKADLFAAVVTHYTDQILEPAMQAAPISDRESFWSSFLGSIEVALNQKYDDHKLVAALHRAWTMSRELREYPEIERQFSRNESLLRNLVALGRKVGAIRTDLPADLVFRCVRALNDAFDDWMAELPPESATAEVTRAIAAFREFLEPKEEKP